MRLSIVIPVYNVEKYIKNTLQSLVRQGNSLSCCEVVIVNDGTKDGAMDIVNKYVSYIPNLLIINQENQGLSVARNKGLEVSTGEYVWFVDSDDTIADDAVQTILNAIESNPLEIYVFDVNKIDENTGISVIEKCICKGEYNKVYSGISLQRKVLNGMVQRFVYNRQFLNLYNLKFLPGIYFEDTDFLVRARFFAKKIQPVDKIVYNYLLRSSGSIMSSFTKKHIYDVFKIIQNFERFKIKYSKSISERAMIEDNIYMQAEWLLGKECRHIIGYEDFLISYNQKLWKLFYISAFLSLNYSILTKLKKMLQYSFLYLYNYLCLRFFQQGA